MLEMQRVRIFGLYEGMFIFFKKVLVESILKIIFAVLNYERALSSVGSEHLPYKQGVTGSNPVGPTSINKVFSFEGLFLWGFSIMVIIV